MRISDSLFSRLCIFMRSQTNALGGQKQTARRDRSGRWLRQVCVLGLWAFYKGVIKLRVIEWAGIRTCRVAGDLFALWLLIRIKAAAWWILVHGLLFWESTQNVRLIIWWLFAPERGLLLHTALNRVRTNKCSLLIIANDKCFLWLYIVSDTLKHFAAAI